LIEVEGEEQVVEVDPVVKMDDDECVHCREQPYVWLPRKKHHIKPFEKNKHKHLLDEDSPPK
jgi:hypothetical protein